MRLEDDPIFGSLVDTAEKKARWLVRLKLAYILWIVFVITGIMMLLIYYVYFS